MAWSTRGSGSTTVVSSARVVWIELSATTIEPTINQFEELLSGRPPRERNRMRRVVAELETIATRSSDLKSGSGAVNSLPDGRNSITDRE